MNSHLVDLMIELTIQFPESNYYKLYSEEYGRETLKQLIIQLDYPEGMDEYDYPVKKIRQTLLDNLINDEVSFPLENPCESLKYSTSKEDIYFLLNEFLIYFRFGYLTDYIFNDNNEITGGMKIEELVDLQNFIDKQARQKLKGPSPEKGAGEIKKIIYNFLISSKIKTYEDEELLKIVSATQNLIKIIDDALYYQTMYPQFKNTY